LPLDVPDDERQHQQRQRGVEPGATIAWAIGGTGVALLNLVFGSGGTWFDPVLPLLVLALIVWYVRGQSLAPAASAVPSRES
jgi:hypothetical protein